MNRKKTSASASVCPQCGAPLAPGRSSCPYCGSHFGSAPAGQTKYCKFCGELIPVDAVICTKCGRQVEELKHAEAAERPIVINNYHHVSSAPTKKPLNKWTAILLCLFLGVVGVHKFYEGKTGLGILYLFTGGLLGIGVIVDLLVLLFKPNPYYI